MIFLQSLLGKFANTIICNTIICKNLLELMTIQINWTYHLPEYCILDTHGPLMNIHRPPKEQRILHMTLPQSGKNLKSFYFSLPPIPLHTFSLSPFFLSFFLPVYLFEETKLFVMSNVRHSGFCSSISMISVMSVTHFFLPLHFL